MCDYLAGLLQEAPKAEPALESPSDRAKRLDRQDLLASGVTLDQVARVRQRLVEVQQGKDTEEIQRFLVEVTMPMRARRAREWREARGRLWLWM